jgi:hypothetical protein
MRLRCNTPQKLGVANTKNRDPSDSAVAARCQFHRLSFNAASGRTRRSTGNSLLAFAYPPMALGASFADMQTVVFGM